MRFFRIYINLNLGILMSKKIWREDVSKEDLINAKVTPKDYKNLRVRVSGFSDYFVFLNEGLQDDIIERTTQK